MMKIQHIYMAVMAAALMASCAVEDLRSLAETPIRLTASANDIQQGESATRAATDIQTGSFDKGATINVYIKTVEDEPVVIGNYPTVYQAGEPSADGVNTLSPTTLQPYYSNRDVEVNILALYPEERTGKSLLEADKPTFTVEKDQQSTDNYKRSDLMWAAIDRQPRTSGAVNLGFSHKMAKMAVTATGEEGVEVLEVHLLNVKRTVEFHPQTGELGDLGDATDNVTISNGGAALLPPQTINGDFIEVVVTVDGGVTRETATFSLTNKLLEGGKQYNAEVTVTRQRIGMTTSITDWTLDLGTTALVPGSSTNMEIEDVAAVEYNGEVQTPEPAIWWVIGGTKNPLTKDVDYQLSYFANRNAGTATIIVTGLQTSSIEDVRKATAVKTFTILPKTGNLQYEAKTLSADGYYEEEYQVNGNVSNTLNKNNGDGEITYTSSNEDVARIVPGSDGVVRKVGEGTTTITATMATGRNYTASTASFKLRITKKSISHDDISVTLSPTTFEYDGQAHEPSVSVTDKDAGGVSIPLTSKDYNVSISGNTEVGTVTVTLTGRGNYTGTNTKKSFTITKVTPTITMENTNMKMAEGVELVRAASTNLGSVELKSSDDKVVSITQAGVLKAIKASNTPVTITATVKGDGKNYNDVSKSYTVTVVNPNQEFAYTGNYQEWTCQVAGTYKLECWGAEGASASYYMSEVGSSGSGTFPGGKGAYVAGTIKLKENDKLYIYVGQHGETGGIGGWNGGGKLSVAAGTNRYAGGGGATDMSLSSGTWDSNNHLYSRIIVAGGGGGAMTYYTSINNTSFAKGGNGGAFVGEDGKGPANGKGGKLNAGGASGGTNGAAGSFGKGGNYGGTQSVGMGGGGWYGGGSGGDNGMHGSGGGGSSYLWNSGNASSYPSGRLAVVTTAYYVTELNKVADSQSGDGHAKITYVSAE